MLQLKGEEVRDPDCLGPLHACQGTRGIQGKDHRFEVPFNEIEVPERFVESHPEIERLCQRFLRAE